MTSEDGTRGTEDSDRGEDGTGTGRSPARDGSTRRHFLQATAGVGALAGVGGVRGARGQPATVELGAAVRGWMGQSPEDVAGANNPTLAFEAGREYRVTWENLDGAPHNFVVEAADGEVLVRSEIVGEQGATQTVSFVADERMAEYYCEVHPASMRGTVEVTGAAGGQPTTTPDRQGGPFAAGPTVDVAEVAAGPLTQPVGLAVAAEDRDRRFVVDQVGQVYVHGPDGLRADPFLDVSDRLVDLGGGFDERGLLGVAFHPGFAENGRLFVRYSAPRREGTPGGFDHTFVLSEFRATGDRAAADPDSERTLLELPEPQANHNAGDLAFGPDGLLYVAVGDGGGANDTGPGHAEDWYDGNAGGNGQDVTDNLLGSVLRLDVDGGDPYAVPGDNPLVGGDGLDEIYAWGFRNPWRLSFDGDRLLVADVGQNRREEVNVVERGGNYGWNVREGTDCFDAANPRDPPADCPDRTPPDVRGGEPLLDPVVEYPHTAPDGGAVGLSVVGGYVYRGSALPALRGRYVFGDWSRSASEPGGRLLVATPPGEGDGDGDDETATGRDGGGRWPVAELTVGNREDGELGRFVQAFGRGREGALYVLASDTGTVAGDGFVYRLVPPGGGDGS